MTFPNAISNLLLMANSDYLKISEVIIFRVSISIHLKKIISISWWRFSITSLIKTYFCLNPSTCLTVALKSLSASFIVGSLHFDLYFSWWWILFFLQLWMHRNFFILLQAGHCGVYIVEFGLYCLPLKNIEFFSDRQLIPRRFPSSYWSSV